MTEMYVAGNFFLLVLMSPAIVGGIGLILYSIGKAVARCFPSAD